MRRLAGLGAAVALLAALAGCSAGASVPPGAVRPLVPVTHPQITQYCADVDAVHFDGDVDSVDRVYICVARELEPDEESYPGTRQQAFRVTDPADLIAAYSAPDSTTPADACIQSIEDPLIVWLWQGEERTAIRAPVDDCGFPSVEAAAAYEAADRAKVQEARERIDG